MIEWGEIMLERCSNCGAHLRIEDVKCRRCGKAVQIVPDYDGSEEFIAGEINNRIEAQERAAKKAREAKKQQILIIKRRRKIFACICVGVLIVLGGVIYALVSNSYSGQLRKGNDALAEKDYNLAIEYFENAIEKDDKKPEPYIGISEVYLAQDNFTDAEKVFTDALEEQEDNLALIEAAFAFYVETEHQIEIRSYREKYKMTDLPEELKEYESEAPVFSLEPAVYEDVQEVTVETSEEEVYYTVDGSQPSIHSTKYEGPIQISEGVTIVRAISINELGVPSFELEAEYTVELPIEDAPIVKPSTGQYDEATSIEIVVPSGYTAYYTMDGTVPSEESTAYESAIEMPEGNTIFSAILIKSNGQKSDVTKRNYDLVLE